MSSLSTCIDRKAGGSLRRIALALLFLAATQAWGQTVEKLVMPGPVISGHAKYEDECAKCHQRFDKSAQMRLCLDCHTDTARDVVGKRRYHGKLAENDCRNCHTEHKGRDAKIAPFNTKTFDHGRTEFPLRDAHADPKVKCEQCHRPKAKYREAPHLCNDCHRKLDQEKGHQGALGPKCETCHDEKSWKDARFDHEKTKFRLKTGGKHVDVKCGECHEDKRYQKTPLTCNGCHQKDDRGDKGHKGKFGIKCESCHNDRSWKEHTFNHDTATKYVLKGKHRQTQCTDCHAPQRGTIYQQKLATRCVACHKDDDRDKGHQGRLGDKCESCHNERDWKSSSFDHDKTEFPLRDKHKDAKCDACHQGGVSGAKSRTKAKPDKVKVDTTCIACHRKDDDEKGHKGRYGTECEKCHTAKNWKTSTFDHDKSTKYHLKGKHRPPVKCDACHLPALGNIYKSNLDLACLSCHRKDDKHVGQLGRKCENCHDESRWDGVKYDHSKSRFPLLGSHQKAECKKCHETAAFRDAPKLCDGCHEKDDKHRRVFGRKCESCHNPRNWASWDFDHGTTRYALDGKHATLACDACHNRRHRDPLKPGRTCIACHDRDDVHDGAFSLQCERCHITDTWKRVRR